MFPADRLAFATTVEYDSRGSRAVRMLPDMFQARRFYVKADRLGLNPKFLRSDAMTETTNTTTTIDADAVATPKAKAKKVAKAGKADKPAAKASKPAKAKAKDAPKAKKAKKEPKEPRVTIRSRVFALLAKVKDGLTMPQIIEKLSLNGPCAIVKHESLRDKPRIAVTKTEEHRGVVYTLTAAGRKAVDNGTVDSDKAPSSVGRSKIRGTDD